MDQLFIECNRNTVSTLYTVCLKKKIFNRLTEVLLFIILIYLHILETIFTPK